jgi:hypothetical protein
VDFDSYPNAEGLLCALIMLEGPFRAPNPTSNVLPKNAKAESSQGLFPWILTSPPGPPVRWSH